MPSLLLPPVLYRLRTVRRSLTKESLLTLVHAFVTSRVDHCNGLLFGSYCYLLDRLQSVLMAARLVLNISKFSNIFSCHSRRAPLASNQVKDRLQDRPHGPTLHGWYCAGVSDGTVTSSWLSHRSTMFPVSFSW